VGADAIVINGVLVRILREPRELEEAVEVHASAWGSRDYREVAPAHLLRGLAANGGLVLGAYLEGRMAGASYGWFVNPAQGRPYFYSHATGVAEPYKYRGVGFALKAAQRLFVLERGVTLIKWTWDPLQSLNSRFNLVKLGAIFREYHVNYYGEMTDEINRDIGTDRVKAEWYLDSELVKGKLEGRLKPPPAEELLENHGSDAIIEHPKNGAAPQPPENPNPKSTIVLVAIPRSVAEVREKQGLQAAVAWRQATREALKTLVARGYTGVDYTRDSQGNPYLVLVKASLEDILNARLPYYK